MSDVLSLFGMHPDVLQQRRVQNAVDQAGRMSADYAIGSAGGQMLGAGINSAFGLQTPEMAQASSIREGLAGGDLGSVEGLRAAARKLMVSGDYAQAMALHQEANDLEKAQQVKAIKTTGVKTYLLPDGTKVLGGVRGDVPVYRKGNEWVPLPDGAIPFTEGRNPGSVTGSDKDAALKSMAGEGWTSTIGGLDRQDKQLMSEWIAARTRELEADYGNLVEAHNQAVGEAATHIKGSGTLFDSFTWTNPVVESTPESTPESALLPQDAVAASVVQQLTSQVAPAGVENLSMSDRIALENEALTRIMEEADVTRKQARNLYHKVTTGKAREYQVVTHPETGKQFLIDPTGFDQKVYPYTGK